MKHLYLKAFEPCCWCEPQFDRVFSGGISARQELLIEWHLVRRRRENS